MYTYKVLVNYKVLDKTNSNYGHLVEQTYKFRSFADAVKYVRVLKNSKDSKMLVLGNPVVEQIA